MKNVIAASMIAVVAMTGTVNAGATEDWNNFWGTNLQATFVDFGNTLGGIGATVATATTELGSTLDPKNSGWDTFFGETIQPASGDWYSFWKTTFEGLDTIPAVIADIGTTLDPKLSGWDDFWYQCQDENKTIGDCVGTVAAGIGAVVAVPVIIGTAVVGAAALMPAAATVVALPLDAVIVLPGGGGLVLA